MDGDRHASHQQQVSRHYSSSPSKILIFLSRSVSTGDGVVQQNFDRLKEAKSFAAPKVPETHVNSITVGGRIFDFRQETARSEPSKVGPENLLERILDFSQLSTNPIAKLGSIEELNEDSDSEEDAGFDGGLLEFTPKLSAFSHTSIWSIF